MCLILELYSFAIIVVYEDNDYVSKLLGISKYKDAVNSWNVKNVIINDEISSVIM